MDGQVTARDPPDFQRDLFGRKDEIDAATVDRALRHLWLNGCIEFLGNRDPKSKQRARQSQQVFQKLLRSASDCPGLLGDDRAARCIAVKDAAQL